jgi:hypothetical protein
MFVFLSSAVVAVLFGPARGPRFIRAAAWLYSRPRSPLEWFGLIVAIAIAAGTQWTAFQAISTDSASFGSIGLMILSSEFIAAAIWLAYLLYLYVIRPARG